LQCEYDSLSTPRQKKPVSRTVGPRPGPWTHCPPLKNFMTWTYSLFTATQSSNAKNSSPLAAQSIGPLRKLTKQYPSHYVKK
ncbi:hypothetical protein J6590_104221, partial [Homalodisca vitripennis]